MLSISASELALFLNTVIIGDDKIINNVQNIHVATQNDLAYCQFKTLEQDVKEINATKAGVVLASTNLLINGVVDGLTNTITTLILVETPKNVFANLLTKYFIIEYSDKSISKRAVIESDAHIGNDVRIGANTYIGHNVNLGDSTIIRPNVTIYDDVIIGCNVLIHSGVVIGDDGLEFSKDDKKLIKMPHIGKVIIKNDVEIQANTVIKRGVLRNTIIGESTKIGSCSVIGHEVTIGKRCIIGVNTSINGSVQLHDDVYVASGVTIRNGVTVSKGAFIGLSSLVTKDVPQNLTVIGQPAEGLDIYQKNRKLLKSILDHVEN
jgi:UDP-3-O-[3-hydroxymyristoyl] glucosamine N-acyltransferase